MPSKCKKCCQKEARFNFKGEKNALYCKSCSEEGMVSMFGMCINCREKTS